jgi:hypothetical protein
MALTGLAFVIFVLSSGRSPIARAFNAGDIGDIVCRSGELCAVGFVNLPHS